VTVLGPKSASARPGPCTRPRSADALTRWELPPGPIDAGVKLIRTRPPAPATGTTPGGAAACGRSSLTPRQAGWSRLGPTGRPHRRAARRRRRTHKVPEVHRLIGASVWAVSAPAGAAALVVGRGGGSSGRWWPACSTLTTALGHRSAIATAPASASIGSSSASTSAEARPAAVTVERKQSGPVARSAPMDMPAICQSAHHGTPRSTSQLPLRPRL
jgi:hypothetical protein